MVGHLRPRLRAQEVDPVGDAGPSRRLLEQRPLGTAAENEQARVAVEARECLNGGREALVPRQAADTEEDRPGPQPQALARLVAARRREVLHRDPVWDDVDAGAVEEKGAHGGVELLARRDHRLARAEPDEVRRDHVAGREPDEMLCLADAGADP